MKGSTQLWTKITPVFILILLCFVFGCQQQGAKIEEENKKIASRIIEEMWNKGDMTVVDELFATDFVLHAPGGKEIKGLEGQKQRVTNVRSLFPDIHMTIDDMIVEGDKVVSLITWRGTHSKFGKQVTVTGIVIQRFEGGKIVEAWTRSDYLSMYTQLGFTLVPPKGQGEK